MSATVCLLLYGVVLAWLCPPVLDRLTRSGINPRLSVAVWLTVITITAAVWLTAVTGLVLDVAVGHHTATPVRYCMDMVLALHRIGWAGDLTLAAVAVAGLAVTVVVARRAARTLRRLTARSHEHAHTAHLVGTPRDGMVIVPSEHATAYSVAGRPSAIVVTSGAVSSLGVDELRAVLAHERAHLRGRHPQLMMLLNALSTALPGLPLVRIGAAAVGRLVEMSADDAAARHHGGDTVLRGLAALAGAPRPGGAALGAGETAVADRALRLSHPAGRSARLWHDLMLTTTMVVLAAVPMLVLALGHR